MRSRIIRNEIAKTNLPEGGLGCSSIADVGGEPLLVVLARQRGARTGSSRCWRSSGGWRRRWCRATAGRARSSRTRAAACGPAARARRRSPGRRPPPPAPRPPAGTPPSSSSSPPSPSPPSPPPLSIPGAAVGRLAPAAAQLSTQLCAATRPDGTLSIGVCVGPSISLASGPAPPSQGPPIDSRIIRRYLI